MLFKFSKYNFVIEEIDNIVTLYNCFTGRFCRLNKNQFELMQSSEFNESVLNRFEVFVQNGFAVPNDFDEALAIQKRKYSILLDTQRKRQMYVIAPTLACNLHCPYCFEQGINSSESMSNDTIKKVVSLIEKNLLPNTEIIYVTFFGGEPLISFNTIVEICTSSIELLKKKNIKFISRLITNGVLLNREKAIILKDKCNLEKVQITLDGLDQNYCHRKNTSLQTYKTVIENICSIYDILSTRIRLNADKENFIDLKNLAKFLLIDLGLKNKIEIYFAQLRDYDAGINSTYYNDEDFAVARFDFYKYLESLGQVVRKITPPKFNPLYCQLMQKRNFVIDPTGNVFKCEHCLGHNDMAVGSLDNELIEDNYLIDRNINNPRCINCNLYPICDYGCIAINKFTGNGKCLVYADKLKQLQFIAKKYFIDSN